MSRVTTLSQEKPTICSPLNPTCFCLISFPRLNCVIVSSCIHPSTSSYDNPSLPMNFLHSFHPTKCKSHPSDPKRKSEKTPVNLCSHFVT
ncbi:hypothetical protein EYC80_005017 [Monilinia laxa]|uniref:Uncharacterized protein n=1 Tax=Monilinia laxa TaxID=61186 RepID=A0A5N6KJ66_MONLA|nr:hypothetical protein EYC80_005017 [Monilinia laxa]